MNFGTNDITAVLQCILPLGARGCAFGRPLAAAARALGADGAPAPPENAGFLRENAYLAIVIVSNRDDCSAEDERFYTQSDNAIASTLGPATPYRCNEFGHLCATAPGLTGPPARKAPLSMIGDVISYERCVPSEALGRLTPVGEIADGLKRLKAAPPREIMVASVQGPGVPYAVHWVSPAVAGEPPWPEVSPSCTAPDASLAHPGVRLQGFAQQFGANGAVTSICEANFGPGLSTVATKLSALIPFGCFSARPWDADPGAGNVQLDCTVVDRLPGGPTGTPVETSIPACKPGRQVPCWTTHPDSPGGGCPPGNLALQILRSEKSTPNELQAEARCKVCPIGQSDPAHGCP